MLVAWLLTAFFLRIAREQEVTFKDCGSVAGTIQNVTVDPCTNPADCELRRGTNPMIKIAFTPNDQATEVKAVVHGIIKGLPVPFPLPNPDACKNSGLTCPLNGKVPVRYTQSFDVRTSYPNIGLLIRWEMKDQNGKDLVCFLIRTHIV